MIGKIIVWLLYFAFLLILVLGPFTIFPQLDLSDPLVAATYLLVFIASLSFGTSIELSASVAKLKNTMVSPFIHVIGSSLKERQLARIRGELGLDDVKSRGIRVENLGLGDARMGIIHVKVENCEWVRLPKDEKKPSFFRIHPGQTYLYPNPGFPELLNLMKEHPDLDRVRVKATYMDILGNEHKFGGRKGEEIEVGLPLKEDVLASSLYDVIEKLLKKLDLPSIIEIIDKLDAETINRLLKKLDGFLGKD